MTTSPTRGYRSPTGALGALWAGVILVSGGAAIYATLLLVNVRLGDASAGHYALTQAVILPLSLTANLGLRSAISVGIVGPETNPIAVRLQTALVSLGGAVIVGLAWNSVSLMLCLLILAQRTIEGLTDIRLGFHVRDGGIGRAAHVALLRAALLPAVALVAPTGLGVNGLVGLQTAVSVVTFVLLDLRFCIDRSPANFFNGGRIDGRLWWLGLNSAMAVGSTSIPRLSLGFFALPADVAWFSIVSTPFLIVTALTTGVTELVAAPAIARRHENDPGATSALAERWIRFTALASIFYGALAWLVLRHGSAHVAIALIAASVLPAGLLGINSSILLALGRVRLISITRILSAVVLGIVALLLVPGSPRSGAAMAVLMSGTGGLLAQYGLLARRTK